MKAKERKQYCDYLRHEDSDLIQRYPSVFELSQLAAALSSRDGVRSFEDADKLVASAYRIWESARDELLAQIGLENSKTLDSPRANVTTAHGEFFVDKAMLYARPFPGKVNAPVRWEDSIDCFSRYNPPGIENVLIACIEDLTNENPDKWGKLRVDDLRENGLSLELLLECGKRAEQSAMRLIRDSAKRNGKRSGVARRVSGEVRKLQKK